MLKMPAALSFRRGTAQPPRRKTQHLRPLDQLHVPRQTGFSPCDPRLHPKNCLGVRQFAETMMCTTLYDAANSFVHQHFVEVSVSEEFLSLRPDEVLELVGCDELNVKAEEQV